ncbi:MAG: acyl-CoA synthetase FdrA [Candidatus Celaenobacter antarcticus]|nr:acyl-CoA synthetase FdrA [Candidatus Celaenobacter antarcticus]
MVVKGKIKRGEYFDSVTLMIVTKQINGIAGITDAAVVMNTAENRSILDSSGLLLSEFDEAKGSDLLICIKADSDEIAGKAMLQVDEVLDKVRHSISDSEDFLPKSLETALKTMPDANLVLISVAGKYAAREAMKALKKGLHVMIFSDNVSLDDEIKLKKYAREKDLFVMGPDCGTAIINGVPLAFANIVNRGKIGIVAASGTGLQEISSIISNNGAGISQAIGTGGRDVKKEVGGIMFLAALDALKSDKNTEIIVLVSKPSAKEVLKKILGKVEDIHKPVIAIFLGADEKLFDGSKAIPAKTLEEAALNAVSISKGNNYNIVQDYLRKRSIKMKDNDKLLRIVSNLSMEQKYLRGLFCGGTLCEEAHLILNNIIGEMYSNITSQKEFLLKDPWKSTKNTLIDMGADEFTVGRPHPMIDYSLRNRRILQEAKSPEVAVILFDVVLGHGSNMHPAEELVTVIKNAHLQSPGGIIAFVCSVTGTTEDPQDKKQVVKKLENDADVSVFESNAAAAEFAGLIINTLSNN